MVHLQIFHLPTVGDLLRSLTLEGAHKNSLLQQISYHNFQVN
jgi:hypothetical protein